MNIKHEIKKMIESYETIIIHRHQRPDMDAIGSQYGLSLLLKENYKDKNIYVVGDLNEMSYLAKMDEISNDTYKDALAIITDVSVTRMISDNRYNLAKDIIIIDHHQNDTDVENFSIFYKDPTFASAAEMVVDLAKSFEYSITKQAATYLYGGMVTDTGRFLYMSNPSQTFELASYITKFHPDIQPFYDYIYTEPNGLEVELQFTLPSGVAYPPETAGVADLLVIVPIWYMDTGLNQNIEMDCSLTIAGCIMYPYTGGGQ